MIYIPIPYNHVNRHVREAVKVAIFRRVHPIISSSSRSTNGMPSDRCIKMFFMFQARKNMDAFIINKTREIVVIFPRLMSPEIAFRFQNPTLTAKIPTIKAGMTIIKNTCNKISMVIKNTCNTIRHITQN